MAVVSMEIPDEMLEFAMPSNKDEQLRINAMILYTAGNDITWKGGRNSWNI